MTLNGDLKRVETGAMRAVHMKNFRIENGYVSFIDTKGLEPGKYELCVWERGCYAHRGDVSFTISEEGTPRHHKLESEIRTLYWILWKWMESIEIYSEPITLGELVITPIADKKVLTVGFRNKAGLTYIELDQIITGYDDLCVMLASKFNSIHDVIPDEDMRSLREHLSGLGQLKYDFEIDAIRLSSLFPRTLELCAV
ncbi:hypothetical protein [Vibrio phage phiKT1019]|nr:hypothetical protein [Vibrio phage phiKT1019]